VAKTGGVVTWAGLFFQRTLATWAAPVGDQAGWEMPASGQDCVRRRRPVSIRTGSDVDSHRTGWGLVSRLGDRKSVV